MNDYGTVTLNEHMGTDLTVVNAARVSFGKQSKELSDKDIKLIEYLATHKHMSPFRHVQFRFTFEGVCEAVARQFYKHQVGAAFTSGEFREAATPWNEISGRYVEIEEDFYQPSRFRKQHENNKQASSDKPIDDHFKAALMYRQTMNQCWTTYDSLIAMGVAKEQARLVLPLAFKTSFTWTASLEAVCHFVKLRNHTGAQYEIRELAKEVDNCIRPICPYSVKALLGGTE